MKRFPTLRIGSWRGPQAAFTDSAQEGHPEGARHHGRETLSRISFCNGEADNQEGKENKLAPASTFEGLMRKRQNCGARRALQTSE